MEEDPYFTEYEKQKAFFTERGVERVEAKKLEGEKQGDGEGLEEEEGDAGGLHALEADHRLPEHLGHVGHPMRMPRHEPLRNDPPLPTSPGSHHTRLFSAGGEASRMAHAATMRSPSCVALFTIGH